MNKIYYDPTGGFLYGIDSNNQPKIVKTDVCVMMPENVFIDSYGYIHVKDLNNEDLIIQDELGNPASIMGPAGPTGSQGILGPQGNDGKDGVSIKLIDSLLNLELAGQTAYIYMLTLDDDDEHIGKVEAGSLYEHNGNVWVFRGSIRGPKGVQGLQGDSITITEIDDSDASKTVITFSDNSKITVVNGTKGANGQDGLPGQDGVDGTSIRLVSSLSDLLLQPAQTGDSCILTENDYDVNTGETVEAGSMYEYNGNAWVYKFSIKGQKGETGSTGPAGQNGADGKDGDTPEIRDGEWYIGGSNTGVKATGQDGKNPFTEEEVTTLNTLPEALSNAQSRIDALETRLAALEQALQNIDLSGLAVAYPTSKEE